MPSTLEESVIESADVTVEEEDSAIGNPSHISAPADSSSNSSCNTSSSGGSDAAAPPHNGDQHSKQRIPAPLGSSERCTWLDLNVDKSDEDQSGISI